MTRARPPSPLASGLVIAGTDTGVGKTIVGAGILRLAARSGLRLVPFKPAESGCRSLRVPADAALLREAAARPDLPLEAICPHQFRPPVAPAAAAHETGTIIRLPALLSAARRLAAAGDALLVEGAGGVLSPYSARLTLLDLAEGLRLPILLVARNALGTINHTALAVAEIRRRGLPLLGYVLSDTSPRPSARQQNERLIAQLTGLKPYARLPFLRRTPTPDAAADALSASRPLRAFLEAHRRPGAGLRGKLALRASSGR